MSRPVQYWHAKHYENILRTIGDEYTDGTTPTETLKKFELEAAQIDHAFKWTQVVLEGSHAAEALFLQYVLGGIPIWNLRLTARDRLAMLKKARKICLRQADPCSEHAIIRHQAAAFRDLGKVNAARHFYQYVLRFTQDDQTKASTLCGLGRLFANTGRVEDAIDCSQKAIELCLLIGDKEGITIGYSNLARAYTAREEYEEAIRYSQNELEVAVSINHKHAEADAYGGLANAQYGLRQYSEAFESYERSLELAREIGDRQGESNELFNSANVLIKLDRNDEARVRLTKAIEMYKELESPYLSNANDMLKKLGQKLA